MLRLPPKVEPLADNIKQLENTNHFNVKSATCDQVYQVDLGKDLPQCSCYDFQKTHWPCKHMLAIFEHYPGNGWEFLPVVYTENIYFNIDKSFIEVSSAAEDVLPSIDPIDQDDSANVMPSLRLEFKVRQECLDILKNIQNDIYNITAIDELLLLKQRLKEDEKFVSSLKQSINIHGLPLRISRKNRKRKLKTRTTRQKRYRIEKAVPSSSVEIDGEFPISQDHLQRDTFYDTTGDTCQKTGSMENIPQGNEEIENEVDSDIHKKCMYINIVTFHIKYIIVIK